MNYQKIYSDSHCAALFAYRLGRSRGPTTEEIKKKISVAQAGRKKGPMSQETKDAMAEPVRV